MICLKKWLLAFDEVLEILFNYKSGKYKEFAELIKSENDINAKNDQGYTLLTFG